MKYNKKGCLNQASFFTEEMERRMCVMYGKDTEDRMHLFQICQRYRGKIFAVFLFILLGFAGISVWDYIPDTLSVQRGEAVSIGDFLPVTKTVKSGDGTVESFGMLSTEECGTYEMEVRLLGIIPVKDVTVHIVDEAEVIPCGVPIGIYVHTKGVLVVDLGKVETEKGSQPSPAGHILKAGDYILAVNGEPVSEKEELIAAVNASGGESVNLTVSRGGEEIPCEITPANCGNGEYRIGAWVRDDMAGIGTLTYVESDGSFGALGHSISDTDTESQVEMAEGKAYLADVVNIVRGEKGNPGELVGQIQYYAQNEIGVIEENNSEGVYGTLSSLPDELERAEPVLVGYKQEIQCGQAQIRVELDGEFYDYEIEIESVDLDPSETNKSIRFRVTDQDLIDKTGGIIQGLSGAPILQNGKIIGAVTHVFVSDPLEGYGIFIEDMLD